MKTDAWLRVASCAALLCSAGAARAASDCDALARPPSWAECAADVSLGIAADFDRPLQLQFDDDAAALTSLDLTMLAVNPSGSPQIRADTPSTVVAIPEPHTNLLMIAGLAAIAFMAIRRRRQ